MSFANQKPFNLSLEAKSVLCAICGYPGYFTKPASAYDEMKALQELKSEGYGKFNPQGSFTENNRAHAAAEDLLFNH